MGIYLPNMEMPTSCEECPLGDSLHCQVLPSVPALWAEYTNAIREKRLHSECPLVPVPPHGDLIDRDAYQYSGDLIYEPVIIPAEEEE